MRINFQVGKVFAKKLLQILNSLSQIFELAHLGQLEKTLFEPDNPQVIFLL
jgi:hypothetical protein